MNRYAPGGDIYEAIAAQHGRAAADRVWQAQESGRSGAVAEALAAIRFGAPLSESTLGILAGQLVTDPLGAPLDSANRAIGNLTWNTIKAFLRNPWVLLAVVVVLAVYFWPLLRPLVGRVFKRA
jgi:hypothetical protein